MQSKMDPRDAVDFDHQVDASRSELPPSTRPPAGPFNALDAEYTRYQSSLAQIFPALVPERVKELEDTPRVVRDWQSNHTSRLGDDEATVEGTTGSEDSTSPRARRSRAIKEIVCGRTPLHNLIEAEGCHIANDRHEALTNWRRLSSDDRLPVPEPTYSQIVDTGMSSWSYYQELVTGCGFGSTAGSRSAPPEMPSTLQSHVESILKGSIALNGTTTEIGLNVGDAFIGSRTETALVQFARDHLVMSVPNAERPSAQLIPFNNADTVSFPELQVVAQSSPADKRELIRKLRELGDIIPIATLTENVQSWTGGSDGYSASHEVVMADDDSFWSIIQAISCARGINDSVRTFLRSLGVNTLLEQVLRVGAIPSTILSNLVLWSIYVALTFVGLLTNLMTGMSFLEVNATPFVQNVSPSLAIRANERKTSSFMRSRCNLLGHLSGPMALAFFIPTVAAQGTNQSTDANWRQRAVDSLVQILVSCAFLFGPIIIALISSVIAYVLRRTKKEGTSALAMLGTAAIFITIRSPSQAGAVDDDRFIRLSIGMSNILFVLGYCDLVRDRNHGDKGFCSVAIGMGILITIISMAFVPVRRYWEDLTHLDPLFALSLAVPMSFACCDLALYVAKAVNDHGRRTDPLLPVHIPLQSMGDMTQTGASTFSIEQLRGRSSSLFRYDSDALSVESDHCSSVATVGINSSPTQHQHSTPPANRIVAWVSSILGKMKAQ